MNIVDIFATLWREKTQIFASFTNKKKRKKMKKTDKIFSVRYQLKYYIEGCSFPSYVHFNCISSCFEFLKRNFSGCNSVIYFLTDLDLNKLIEQARY